MIQLWGSTVKRHQFPPLNSDTITIWLKDCWQWCYKLKQKTWWTRTYSMYNWNSVARTALGPWKFVQDMIYSSHWGLITVPGQEANGDIFGEIFSNYSMMVGWVYSLELPHTTYNTKMKQKHFPKCLFSQVMRRISWGLKKEFELANMNEPSEFELLKFDCSVLLFLNVKGTQHLQKRVFLTGYELLLKWGWGYC